MSFITNSDRRNKSSKKCPNKKDLVNWARVTHKKPGLPTTCFLLKNVSFFTVFRVFVCEVLYFSLVLEFYVFFFLSFVSFVLRHSISGTHRRNPLNKCCISISCMAKVISFNLGQLSPNNI